MSAQVIKLGEGYFFLKIDNFLTQNELDEVWDEIKFLSYRSKLELDRHIPIYDGQVSSNKISVWFDELYSAEKFSNYLKYHKKWFTLQAYNNLLKTSLFWRELEHAKCNSTKFSYYEDDTFYKSHQDTARLTQLYYTFKEPKKFSGGELVFTDFNYTIEIKNNTLIVFPSWFEHQVNPVILKDKTPENQDKLECNGRCVFTTFYK